MAQPRQFNEPDIPQQQRVIAAYRATLEGIYSFLSFDSDLRKIRKTDINVLEQDLRAVIAGIEKLRDTPDILHLVISVDGLQEKLHDAIDSLYFASDLLEEDSSGKSRKMFYQTLRDCQKSLLEAQRLILV